MTEMKSHLARIALLACVAIPARASVWLSTYTFDPRTPPTISSNDTLTAQYKLRAKINQGPIQTTNSFGNNGQPLDGTTFPAAGNYTVDLYYLQYDSTGTTLLTQGTHSTYNITVVNGAVPVTSISATGTNTVTGNPSNSGPPVLYVASGAQFTISSVTNDADNNLTTQQFDLSSDGGTTWSLGNSSNSRLWSGTVTGSNTLSKTFSLGDGHYRFRAQGMDNQQQFSTYQYVDVVVGTVPTVDSSNQNQLNIQLPN